MCGMCEGSMAGMGSCYDEPPSAAELRNEEIEQEWSRQTCDTCGFPRIGCNCPEEECDCDVSYFLLRNPGQQW